MDQIDLLRQLVGVLDRLDVPYMVVGSLASAAYGEPRMTQDIDVVVDLKELQVPGLCHAFSSDEFHVSERAALEAVRRKGQFNIIHPTSGNKIDLLIVPASAWGQAEMSRRQRMRILPDTVSTSSRQSAVDLEHRGRQYLAGLDADEFDEHLVLIAG